MSPNKLTVQRYMDAFTRTDHAEILSCLTDDVVWLLPGVFHLTGKEAFDKEIENDAFVGSPTIWYQNTFQQIAQIFPCVAKVKKPGRNCFLPG